MTDANLDPQICRQCKGLCCQGHPGVWADPCRFADIFMAGKKFSLEQLRGRLGELDLQLRDYSGVSIPAPLSSETGCVMLRADGCSLEATQRPCQCLGLTPEIETLMTGEIHCRTPAELSYGRVRQNWLEYWAGFPDKAP